jgi:hypothetical protein
MHIMNEDELTISLLQGNTQIDIPKCKIILKGDIKEKIFLGSTLEAAINWNNFYLLFLTYTVPYEHMLNIYFLDQNINILDSANLGSIHATEPFSSLKLIEPNNINFRFISETEWQVGLLKKSVFSLPFFTNPIGISRKFSFKKYFTISKNTVKKVTNI